MEAIKMPFPDISKILRCHLIVEYFLDQIIIATHRRGDIISTNSRFTFSYKLTVVQSIDFVDNNILISIKHLNEVRNKCSHKMDYKISKEDADLIGRPFGTKYTKIKSNSKSTSALITDILMMLIAMLEGNYIAILDAQKKDNN
ncbi:MAG: hypothetical protein WC693_00555 [Patescibacteria group bacterium]